MRSLIVRLVVAGAIGFAVAGCGGGGSVSPGSLPNGSGGGTVPVTSATAAPGTIPSVLIDGGVFSYFIPPSTTIPIGDAYAPYNMSPQTFSDTPYCQPSTPPSQCTQPDAGPGITTYGSEAPPTNPNGWQDLTFQGSGVPQDIFQYLTVPLPNLTYYVPPGNATLQTYGSIVMYLGYTPGPLTGPQLKPPGLAVELTGGSGASTYDLRIACNTGAAAGILSVPGAFWTRVVCDLPAYGSASGSYTTKYAPPTGLQTIGTFSLASAGPAIQNPIVSNAAGQFTPYSSVQNGLDLTSTMYIVLTPTDGLQPNQTGNQLAVDFVYAQQGTQ